MAQGFIIPSDGKSFEAVGEECFMNLLQRCFFQDVERDVSGEIVSCKMHDLIHDLAKEVAGKELYDASCLNEQPRHVFVDTRCTLPKMTRARTILRSGGVYFGKGVLKQLRKGRYLRVLDLHSASLGKNLPSMIVEMLHLRYLDLSTNWSLKVLPMSIGQLYNLQTLKLRNCRKLEELPRELSKLVNLRHLDTYGCDSLTHMPQGMNCMTNLHKLPLFVLGRANGSSSAAGPGDLKDLNNLRGGMEIKVKTGWKYDAAAEVGKGEYLIKKRHLMNINICWDYPYVDYNAEVLLPGLEPPTEIRKLGLLYYPGLSFPSWSMNFPKLVNIELYKCKRLEHLPLMNQLPLLKVLVLRYLAKVEYVESSVQVGANGEVTFFPSLEKLTLEDMPKLKGWWKTSSSESNLYSFTQLSYLRIRRCPNLTTFPLYPNVEELKLCEFNGALGPSMRADGCSTSSDGEGQGQGRLKKVGIDNVGYLNSLPIQSFHHLIDLQIWRDSKIERLGIEEVGEVFRSGRLSSLRSLRFWNCKNLKSISGRGVWEHFTALETLILDSLPELELEDEDDVNNNNSSSGCTREEGEIKYTVTPWRYLAPTLRSLEITGFQKLLKGMHHLTALHHLKISDCVNLEAVPPAIGDLSSLRSLTINKCDNLETLPPAIGGLSSLRSLTISDCKRLKSLPEEMRHLTSVNELVLRDCNKELKERCKEPNGADRSKIIHIPNIKFYN